jgi:hypothetical protein
MICAVNFYTVNHKIFPLPPAPRNKNLLVPIFSRGDVTLDKADSRSAELGGELLDGLEPLGPIL